ncbi:SDR family NAD(P)-dependent oxidoreductase, partial [Pseudomonas shirazica]|uniref:SDR family NAD(P)-dependent oxidoreductase n=1 Tax=Pseudomonas shirazica TaxID=1940636 RepID=UPI00352688CF
GIAGGVDTTSDAPIGVNEGLRKILLEANRGKSNLDKLKTLAKMSSDFWNSVINVNLNAPQVLTQALLDGGKLHDNGRVVLLASISGIAGNLGQSNYAVSK